MLRLVLLLLGFCAGIVATSIWTSMQRSPIKQEAESASEFDTPATDKTTANLIAINSPNSQNTTQSAPDCFDLKTTGSKTVDDELLIKLARTRGILPDELSIMYHWTSMQDLESYLQNFNLADVTWYRIIAKAEVYFNENYLAALQQLYAARHIADEDNLKVIDREIASLVDYIQHLFFSSSPKVNREVFINAMNLVNEKQPGYLTAVISLVHHYSMTQDWALVERNIDSIPQDYDNQMTIDLLKKQLRFAQDHSSGTEPGIPLMPLGDQYVAQVILNGRVGLNLLLDTHSPRTIISHQLLGTIQKMTRQIEHLGTNFSIQSGNRSRANIFQIKEMSLGGYKLEDPIIFSAPVSPGEGVDGLLGMDFLKHFSFRIDKEQNRLYLTPK